MTQSKDVRWLSHEAAMQTVRKCYQSLIVSLERQAEEKGDTKATGLAVQMQKYNFIAALMMMCDALPILAQLSRAMQVRVLYLHSFIVLILFRKEAAVYCKQ